MDPWFVAILAMLGFVAGAVGTLMGIGGGSIVSPTLIALGIEPHYAVSSSLATVVGTSLGGLIKFFKKRLVKVKIALILEAATMIGAVLGGCIALKLPSTVVAMIVALVLAMAGTITLLQEHIKPCRRLSIAVPLSMVAGIVSAMSGIGGGVIKMPIMLAILGLDLRAALATSKMMVGITAATGLSTYLAQGVFDPYLALPLAVGSYLGASMTARLVTELEKQKLRKVAASLYYAMSILTFARILATT